MAVAAAVWQVGPQENISAQSPGRPCRRKGVSEPLCASVCPEETGPPSMAMVLGSHRPPRPSVASGNRPWPGPPQGAFVPVLSGSVFVRLGFPVFPPRSTACVPAPPEPPAVCFLRARPPQRPGPRRGLHVPSLLPTLLPSCATCMAVLSARQGTWISG